MPFPSRHFSSDCITRLFFVPLLAALLALPAGGCGTLFGGDSLNAEIMSNPPGARVRLDGEVIGTTPLQHKIDPLAENKVEAKLDGWQDYSGTIDITVNLPTVANFLFPPFFIVDLITGKWARARPLRIVFIDEDGNRAPEPEW